MHVQCDVLLVPCQVHWVEVVGATSSKNFLVLVGSGPSVLQKFMYSSLNAIRLPYTLDNQSLSIRPSTIHRSLRIHLCHYPNLCMLLAFRPWSKIQNAATSLFLIAMCRTHMLTRWQLQRSVYHREPLSPVHTSNNVKATLPNATCRTILSTKSKQTEHV